MYIAFKWLLFLAFNMWLAMCIIDLFTNGNIKRIADGDIRHFKTLFKNASVEYNLKPRRTTHHTYYDKGQNMACLHIAMFLAGALAVTTYYKRQEIKIFTQDRIAKIKLNGLVGKLSNLKNTASKLNVTITKYTLYFLSTIKIISVNICHHIISSFKAVNSVKQNQIQATLLNKLKEMRQERKSLGQLLISAIHENKNIRMRYQLETMSKNRLINHIEDTQKQVKENRSRYMNFQQLYLATQQENIFLKTRLGKVKKEKDDAEKNLMYLIHEIYRSQNKELKAYCSRFIVKSKDKLLNLDVNAEIEEFMNKTCVSSAAARNSYSEHINNAWPRCTTRITEILNEDDCLVPSVTDVPKLKGLPGECIWTVKDKNGIIEKLYEYDYEPDLDNGDTIKKIRQYSVYYDRDGLLDFSRSRTHHEDPIYTSDYQERFIMLNNISTNNRFLTGSQAFQHFLQSNNSIVPIKSSCRRIRYN